MTQTAVPNRVLSGSYDLSNGQAIQPAKGAEWSTTVALGPLEDPGTADDHVLSYMIGKDRSGGQPVGVTVVLMEGDSELMRFDHPDVPSGIRAVKQSIPPAVADKITDYSNLRIRMDFRRGS